MAIGGKQASDEERAAALREPATVEELAMLRIDAVRAYRQRTGSSLGQAVVACATCARPAPRPHVCDFYIMRNDGMYCACGEFGGAL